MERGESEEGGEGVRELVLLLKISLYEALFSVRRALLSIDLDSFEYRFGLF